MNSRSSPKNFFSALLIRLCRSNIVQDLPPNRDERKHIIFAGQHSYTTAELLYTLSLRVRRCARCRKCDCQVEGITVLCKLGYSFLSGNNQTSTSRDFRRGLKLKFLCRSIPRACPADAQSLWE